MSSSVLRQLFKKERRMLYGGRIVVKEKAVNKPIFSSDFPHLKSAPNFEKWQAAQKKIDNLSDYHGWAMCQKKTQGPENFEKLSFAEKKDKRIDWLVEDVPGVQRALGGQPCGQQQSHASLSWLRGLQKSTGHHGWPWLTIGDCVGNVWLWLTVPMSDLDWQWVTMMIYNNRWLWLTMGDFDWQQWVTVNNNEWLVINNMWLWLTTTDDYDPQWVTMIDNG